MQEAIEHGGDGGVVAEQLSPVLDGAVGGEDGAGAFVATHHQLEKVLCGARGQLAHAEVVDDEYLRDLLRVLAHWPKDRFLELAPKFWTATRARLDPTQLANEVGLLDVPPPAQQ
jgi:hypothetical protein